MAAQAALIWGPSNHVTLKGVHVIQSLVPAAWRWQSLEGNVVLERQARPE